MQQKKYHRYQNKIPQQKRMANQFPKKYYYKKESQQEQECMLKKKKKIKSKKRSALLKSHLIQVEINRNNRHKQCSIPWSSNPKSCNMKKSLDCNNVIGHTMKRKEDTHTRVCILSPNRISMNNNCEQHHGICDTINKNSIDYFGCP
eukprot:3774294-Ditylum_brightwellii.AAC.1